MTADQKIAVLERMRELLADPDRVVLDPDNLFEAADGTFAHYTVALDDSHCRACLIGSAYVAAGSRDLDDEGADWANEIVELMDEKCATLGIPSRGVDLCTTALYEGRAVEVVDAVLADLRCAA